MPDETDGICPAPLDNDRRTLDERADMIVSADAGAIMIPESAFEQALKNARFGVFSGIFRSLSRVLRFLFSPFSAGESTEHASRVFAPDADTRLKAVALAGTANELGTLGIIGDLQETGSPRQFSGKLFIVLRNSQLVGREAGRIESTDYYIAAVELSGQAPWLGANARFAVDNGLIVATGRCCGPKTICGVPTPGTLTPLSVNPPPPPPRPALPCDLSFCPSEYVGVTPIVPPELQTRLETGSTLVKLIVFTDGWFGAGRPDPEPLEAGCINVLDKLCPAVKPVCDEGDVGFTPDPSGGGDWGSGSNPCAPGVPVSINKVPKICTLISDWGELPGVCGGWCEHCSEPYYMRHKLPPGCTLQMPMPGSDICRVRTPAQEFMDNEAMRRKVGWVRGRRKSLCESTGRDGIRVCTECDEEGRCGQRVEKPLVDPTIANEPDDEEDQDREWVPPPGYLPGVVIVGYETVRGELPSNDPPSVEYEGGVSNDDDPPNPPLEPPPPTDLRPVFSEFPPQVVVDQPQGASRGDPIRLGDGSFRIEHVDLSFDCPVGALQFRRTYNSRSRSRSPLGSNWLHNWDVRIQPLNEETTPAWASPYCAGSAKTVTCLLLHEGDGSIEMFCLDLQTRLFMPQAGSTDTIASTNDGGWALRRKDGYVRYFNKEGYLVNERDRFGNGFSIEYERTPLAEMYQHYCSPEALAGRKETKHSRRCAVLAYLNEEASMPASDSDAWKVTEADFELPDRGLDPERYDRLTYARAYFLYLLSLGRDVQSVYGFRKLRPTQVTDDLGRSLQFSYYRAPLQQPSLPEDPPTFDFVSAPEAELLKEVRGPVGTSVRFTYAQPRGYPSELNEQFLIQVDRHDEDSDTDVEPAPDRWYRFDYQWPENRVGSYDAFANQVYEKYRAYYSTFVGCTYKLFLCEAIDSKRGPLRVSKGDPAALARRKMNSYISDVADNILEVVSNGVSESETRFATDPMSPTFDRATAQRYGSQHTRQDPGLLPPDDPAHNWRTSLPRLVFDYQEAGPADGGDLTDSFLPAEVRDRYPMETAPPYTPPGPELPSSPLPGREPESTRWPLVGADDPTYKNPCDYSRMRTRMKELPGYRESRPYYEVQKTEAHPHLGRPLYRSNLSSEQLALAQASDPTHNDLLSFLEPNPATPGDSKDHIAKRLVGRRPVIAANANRICAWVRVIDRDGDRSFYGLNYRGQVLVEAAKERDSDSFLFTERIYNADGLVVQLRRPMRGAQPWSEVAGYTAYTYEEIDPAGNRGWNDWLPVFWSRRTNLRRVENRPAGLSVVDDVEGPSGTFESSIGRFQRFTYEPLFNQIKSIEEGSIELSGPQEDAPRRALDIPHSRLDYVYDYQELSLGAPGRDPSSMDPVLDDLRPWGFHWLLKADGAYDYQAIGDWQLPVKFYNTDVNGDGAVGFGYGDRPAGRARGVPVAEIRSRPGTSADPQVRRMAWAPHGKLAGVRGLDGSLTNFRYYSIDPGVLGSPYGQNRPPTDEEVSGGFRGFLAQVRIKRFPEDYRGAYGPTEDPCSKLAGPYQWLLPDTCVAPELELSALGLPEETVQAILDSRTENGRWLVASFSYSRLGRVRFAWEDTRPMHVVRDTDGRELQVTDPQDTRTYYSYTVDGHPKLTRAEDASGDLLGETCREFDEEGRLTYECQALSGGGCDPYGSYRPADGVVNRYEYWPEGNLRTAIDPEGLQTEFRYNERGLLIHQKSTSPAFPGEWRATSYAYNLDGDLVATHYGDQTGSLSGLLSESFTYDGFGRLTKHTDTRGYAWQMAYSNRDLLTRFKRDDTPYGSAGPAAAPPTLETVLEYDDFGRLLRRSDNGTLSALYVRTEGGAIYQASSEGIRKSYTTYDLLGRPVWTRDAAGNQVVHTWRSAPHESSTATIRTDGKGAKHTTATITRLDALGLPREEIRYASGIRQRTTWRRNGAGFVLEQKNPEGYLTIYEPNFLGWPTRISEQRGPAGPSAPFDVASFYHNKRGQVEEVVDPAKQRTIILHDAFGAVRNRSIAGQPQVEASFSYDALGRVDKAKLGAALIKYDYDNRGDLVQESVETFSSYSGGTFFMPISRRSYDDLGRVARTENFNPLLSHLLPDVADRTVTQEFDYDALGRLSREQLQVGAGAPHPVYSDWSIVPGDVWQRRMRYPVGAGSREWWETFDEVGRLARKTRLVGGPTPLETTFRWLGELYTGREQEQAGRPSPFREHREVDEFGLTAKLRYMAIDVDQSQQPRDAAEGRSYCGGRWSAAGCSRPLLEMEAVRDLLGRIVSLKWRFGHPRFSSGGVPLGGRHPAPWRGYGYNPRQQLDRTWEHEGIPHEVLLPPTLRSYSVTAADIRNLASRARSAEWVYDREPPVGGTTAIRNRSTGRGRWALSVPRGRGHQVEQYETDGSIRTVTYDPAGRIQTNGAFTYLYDPRGQLAAVVTGGAIVEAYAYDAGGRLAAVFTGNRPQPPALSFAYDDEQIVAAFDDSNSVVWEAAWGPGLDQLIEWRDRRATTTVDHIPLVDHRNSVVATWNVNQGRVSQTAEYNPEGRLLIRASDGRTTCREQGTGTICANPVGIPFGFLSVWRSRVTGLVYLRNRWYSTELGQFISHDPLGFIDSYNLYAYAAFDPINNLDPLGLGSEGAASTMIPYPTQPTSPGPPGKLPIPPIGTGPPGKPPIPPIGTGPPGKPIGPHRPGGLDKTVRPGFMRLLGQTLSRLAFLGGLLYPSDLAHGTLSPERLEYIRKRGMEREREEQALLRRMDLIEELRAPGTEQPGERSDAPGLPGSAPIQDPAPPSTAPHGDPYESQPSIMDPVPEGGISPMEAGRSSQYGRSAWRRHHLLTNKQVDEHGRPYGFTKEFENILNSIGLSVESGFNTMMLPEEQHPGRHPNEYHMTALYTLLAAQEGTLWEWSTARLLSAEERLVSGIDELRAEIRSNPNILRRRGWGR